MCEGSLPGIRLTDRWRHTPEAAPRQKVRQPTAACFVRLPIAEAPPTEERFVRWLTEGVSCAAEISHVDFV
jgi:hypothetical protein